MRSVTERPIPGGWSERQISVAGRCFHIVLATDPDKFLDDYTEDPSAPRELRDPYWARLWPVSEEFAAYLSEQPIADGTRVLEIGCGLGLTGLALLARGCHLTFSDYVPLAVEAALENSRRNGFVGVGRIMDWHETHAEEKWPLVVGSDLVYDRTLHRPLLNFLGQILEPEGECWLADPGRSISLEFLLTADDCGMHVSLRDRQGRPTTDSDLGRFQVIVVRRQRGAGPRG
jgi:predicted nicotinamide N-methyase